MILLHVVELTAGGTHVFTAGITGRDAYHRFIPRGCVHLNWKCKA